MLYAALCLYITICGLFSSKSGKIPVVIDVICVFAYSQRRKTIHVRYICTPQNMNYCLAGGYQTINSDLRLRYDVAIGK